MDEAPISPFVALVDPPNAYHLLPVTSQYAILFVYRLDCVESLALVKFPPTYNLLLLPSYTMQIPVPPNPFCVDEPRTDHVDVNTFHITIRFADVLPVELYAVVKFPVTYN